MRAGKTGDLRAAINIPTGWSSLALLLLSLPANAENRTLLSGSVAAETRLFPSPSLSPRSGQVSLSLFAEPELYHEWAGGRQSFTVKALLRLDQTDPSRSHFDLREFHWQRQAQNWKLRAGISKVFWGVTEFLHLVDIVNQTDLVEEPRGEQKLGQPMVQATFPRSWGTLDLLFLPVSRERTFPGPKGRLRPSPALAAERAWLKGRLHPGLALRWAHTRGAMDVSVSHFRGVGREPDLLPEDRAGTPVLAPRYRVIQQTGLDTQATLGAWLLKLEAIYRTDGPRDFLASTGGFEYTFVGIGGGKADLGILSEYMIDGRGAHGATPFASDIFTGVRIGFNDVQSSELLAGAVIDYRSGSAALLAEGSRRIAGHWKLKGQSFIFLRTEPGELLHSFRKDSFVQLSLNYHF